MTIFDAINPYAWIVKLLRGFSKPRTPKILSINVGNLRTGGTGKTPLVIEIAKRFENSAVITLGYGRKYKGVYNSLEYPSPEYLGDEGYMIFIKTGRPVIASKDRFKGVEIAGDLGANLVIFDDAFQYFKLRAHINILLLRPADLKASTLPFGPLREPNDAIKYADVLVFNLKLEEKPFKPPNLEKPSFVMRYKVEGVEYNGGVLDLRGLRVFPFCGIADPFSFINALKISGAEVVGYRIFPDHWWIKGVEKIIKKAEDLRAIPVCTEKDFYRIGGDKRVGFLKIKPVVDGGFWEFLDERIRKINLT
ncbi:MAG: tetraacyldisaccharide 4'-kinase [candidate division WOR-3 bacterium]